MQQWWDLTGSAEEAQIRENTERVTHDLEQGVALIGVIHVHSVGSHGTPIHSLCPLALSAESLADPCFLALPLHLIVHNWRPYRQLCCLHTLLLLDNRRDRRGRWRTSRYD
eukprot:1341217-Amorphochlora_amoeboformis.AAC.2